MRKLRLNYLLALVAVCISYACSSSEGETTSSSSNLSVNPSSLEFSNDGGSLSVSVISNTDWSISGLPDWIAASKVSGINNGTIKLTATANENIDDRKGSFSIYTNDNKNTVTVSVSQEGTHLNPLQVENSDEKLFSGKVLSIYEDSIIVTSNTRWTIEGPSWLSAVFNNKELSLNGDAIREGAGVIYLRANENYNGEEARQSVVAIKTLSSSKGIEIPVTQLGKDDIRCVNTLILSDGFLFELKFGSNVAAFRWEAYEGEIAPSDLTYDNIKNYWMYRAATAPGEDVLWVGGASPSTDYTLYFIRIDSNNYLSSLDKVNKQSIHTSTDVNQPRANISNVSYSNGTWHWDMNMNDYAGGYYINAFQKSYFEGWNLSICKPYFAYLMLYVENLFLKESTWIEIPSTDNLIICAWAVGKDGKLSNTVDYYVTNNNTSNAREYYLPHEKSGVQTGGINKKEMPNMRMCKGLTYAK